MNKYDIIVEGVADMYDAEIDNAILDEAADEFDEAGQDLMLGDDALDQVINGDADIDDLEDVDLNSIPNDDGDDIYIEDSEELADDTDLDTIDLDGERQLEDGDIVDQFIDDNNLMQTGIKED